MKENIIFFSSTPLVGVWGKPSSSIDWCEPNYEWSYYVAEFFNTFSSLLFVVIGLIGYCYHNPISYLSLAFSWLSIMIIGIGSTGFHMTLSRSTQMMDELPMIWSMFLLLYHSLLIYFPKGMAKYRNDLILLLCLLNTISTLIYLLSAEYYFIFVSVYVSITFFTIFFLVRAIQTRNKYLFSEQNIARQLFKKAILYFLLAGIFWLVDLFICIPWFYGHALWHLFISISVYLIILTQHVLLMESIQTSSQMQIQYLCGWSILPIINNIYKKTDYSYEEEEEERQEEKQIYTSTNNSNSVTTRRQHISSSTYLPEADLEEQIFEFNKEDNCYSSPSSFDSSLLF